MPNLPSSPDNVVKYDALQEARAKKVIKKLSPDQIITIGERICQDGYWTYLNKYLIQELGEWHNETVAFDIMIEVFRTRYCALIDQ